MAARAEGEIPIVSESLTHIIGGTTLRWEPVLQLGRRHIVPLFEVERNDLTTLLARPFPERPESQDETLVVFLRSSFVFENFNGACLGVGIMSEGLPDSAPFDQTTFCPTIQRALDIPHRELDADDSEFIRDLHRGYWVGRRAAHERYMRERLVLDAAHKAASERALRLLEEHLSPQQLADLEATKGFMVVGSDGHTYRIARGSRGNVFRVNRKGQLLWRFCAHITESFFDARYPDEDHMLAQKLLLEIDAPSFLKLANVFRMPRTISS